MDENFTFIDDKKPNLYSDRRRSKNQIYFGLGSGLDTHQEAIQVIVDQAPKAKQYYSDGFDAYQWLWCHFGRYEISKGKADTYFVEADNAELRHYVVFLGVLMRLSAPCIYSSMPSTADNFINNAFQIMPHTFTLLAHDI